MRKIIILALLLTSLSATTFTLNPGWNLLGHNQSIEVSTLLKNSEVRNVVIYDNGVYKSSASNEFTTIPANKGFFVYTDSSLDITVSTGGLPSSTLQRLDGNLNPTTDASWDILKIVDANLLLEMKTSTYNAGLTYTHTEAVNYCQNLTIGTVTGWRLPTIGELKALADIYGAGNADAFIIRSSGSYYWSGTDYNSDRAYYSKFEYAFEQHDRKTNNNYAICVKSIN